MVAIGLILFIFSWISILAVIKHREYLFQVRSRLLVLTLYASLMFLVSLHYALSLHSSISIFFVIVQEFLKISIFWYVVFFYLKNAYDFSLDNSRNFVKWMKRSLIVFLIFFGLALIVWMILRIWHILAELPWKDGVWLIYRFITLLLITWIIFSGVSIQK